MFVMIDIMLGMFTRKIYTQHENIIDAFGLYEITSSSKTTEETLETDVKLNLMQAWDFSCKQHLNVLLRYLKVVF